MIPFLLYALQKPLWCEKYTPYSCNDREYFFLGQLPYLTGAECVIYEVRVYGTADNISVIASFAYELLEAVTLKMLIAFCNIYVILTLNSCTQNSCYYLSVSLHFSLNACCGHF